MPHQLPRNYVCLDDDARSGADSIIPIDWQTVGRSRPGIDLATMIGFGFEPDSRRAHVNDLLSLYHSRLVGHGIDNYSWDELITDFRLGLLLVLGKVLPNGGSDCCANCWFNPDANNYGRDLSGKGFSHEEIQAEVDKYLNLNWSNKVRDGR